MKRFKHWSQALAYAIACSTPSEAIPAAPTWMCAVSGSAQLGFNGYFPSENIPANLSNYGIFANKIG